MKVMVNSIPKGGTHLLLKLVYLLGIPDDPKRFWLGAGVVRRGFEPLNRIVKGGYEKETVEIGSEVPVRIGAKWLRKKLNQVPDGHSFGAHCLHSDALSRVLEASGVRPVCIIRDPRAIVVSHMHYVKGWRKHFYYKDYMRLPSDRDRLIFSIKGGRLGKYEVKSLRERYKSFVDWVDVSMATVVRFEDLVGAAGGGSDQAQREAILLVARHLGLNVQGSVLDTIQKALFGDKGAATQSTTFRKGRADAWRSELAPDLVAMVEDDLSDILEKLGYVG